MTLWTKTIRESDGMEVYEATIRSFEAEHRGVVIHRPNGLWIALLYGKCVGDCYLTYLYAMSACRLSLGMAEGRHSWQEAAN